MALRRPCARPATWTSSRSLAAFTLGPRILDRGAVLLRTHSVARVAEPHVRALRDVTQENAHLGVEYDGAVVYLLKAEASASLGIRSDIGKRVPMHCTAMGKALLSALDESAIRRFALDRGLRAETRNTIVDIDALLADLTVSRARGYSVEYEEYQIGGTCVGAPVWGPAGAVQAAISVSVPTARLSDERLESVVQQVVGTAEQISRVLHGGRPETESM